MREGQATPFLDQVTPFLGLPPVREGQVTPFLAQVTPYLGLLPMRERVPDDRLACLVSRW